MPHVYILLTDTGTLELVYRGDLRAYCLERGMPPGDTAVTTAPSPIARMLRSAP